MIVGYACDRLHVAAVIHRLSKSESSFLFFLTNVDAVLLNKICTPRLSRTTVVAFNAFTSDNYEYFRLHQTGVKLLTVQALVKRLYMNNLINDH